MPKRKFAQNRSGDTSDLSSPPDGLLENGENISGLDPGPPPAKRARVKKEVISVQGEVSRDATNLVHEDVKKVRTQRKGTKKGVQGRRDERKQDSSPTAPQKREWEQDDKVEGESIQSRGAAKSQTKGRRNTKAEKGADAMPLAARTVGHKLFIGAHVSAAGGVHKSVANSVHIGANAFALFLKSQRKWANPAMVEDHCLSFHEQCKHHAYEQTEHVVPHGSYLVNLAHTDQARTKQAYDSYLDDLQRCEKLGIKLYNIHPGNTVKNDRQEAISHLAENINRAHRETKTVVTLLENMAAGGNVLGSTFEDLRDIITQVTDKSRIGVCIDTCHAFAGGYDLRSPAAFATTMEQFEETVGFRYLRALHLNDSKAPFDSHRDLHANIGTGFLGLRAFHNLVNDPRFEGLPLILETPIEVRDEDGKQVKNEKGKEKEDKGIWAREIKLLESLVGMDTESETFIEMEKQLSRQGRPERERLADQMDRKREKEGRKANKKKKTDGKGSRGGKAETDSEDDSEPESEGG